MARDNLGTIKRASADKNKLVKADDGARQPANFIVLYTDDSEGPHCLTLSMSANMARDRCASQSAG